MFVQHPGHLRRILEVDLLRMRTREGMAVARAKGKLRGKQPKLSAKQQRELMRMYGTGEYTIADLAEVFAVSRTTGEPHPPASREIKQAQLAALATLQTSGRLRESRALVDTEGRCAKLWTNARAARRRRSKWVLAGPRP